MIKKIVKHIKDVAQGKTSITVPRSGKWHKVEKEHLEANPACAVCGDLKSVQVHHIFPFHYCVALGRPDLELDLKNLITLCETSKERSEQNHHLLIGHYDDFKSSNLDVVKDSKAYQGMTGKSIQMNASWIVKRSNKLKPLKDMSEQDKKDFIDLMNKTFPLK